MRIALRVILAAAIAGAYALVTGFLSVRAEFLQGGLWVGSSYDDVSIVGPQFPLLHFAGIALLSGLCTVYILSRLRRRGTSGYAEAIAFVAVLLALVVWGVLNYELSGLQMLDLTTALTLQYASLSPALHTVAAVVAIVAMGQAVRGLGVTIKKRRSADAGADSAA